MRMFLSLALACLIGGVAKADLIIDDFSTGNSGTVPQVFTSLGTYPVFTSTGAGILGGVRKWQVAVTAHGVGNTQIYDVAGGEFGIANGFQQNANVAIRWDSQDNSAMTGAFSPVQDLSQAGVNDLLSLRISSADLSTQFQVVITDADSSSAVTKSFSGPASTDYLFSEFVGINFADVTSMQLNISGPNAYDVAIANFVATTAVPEPSSVALLGLVGMAGMFVRRSRSKSHLARKLS